MWEDTQFFRRPSLIEIKQNSSTSSLLLLSWKAIISHHFPVKHQCFSRISSVLQFLLHFYFCMSFSHIFSRHFIILLLSLLLLLIKLNVIFYNFSVTLICFSSHATEYIHSHANQLMPNLFSVNLFSAQYFRLHANGMLSTYTFI